MRVRENASQNISTFAVCAYLFVVLEKIYNNVTHRFCCDIILPNAIFIFCFLFSSSSPPTGKDFVGIIFFVSEEEEADDGRFCCVLDFNIIRARL